MILFYRRFSNSSSICSVAEEGSKKRDVAGDSKRARELYARLGPFVNARALANLAKLSNDSLSARIFWALFIFHLASLSLIVARKSARRTAESAARTWSTETATMGCTTLGSAKEAKRCACSARASSSPYAALLIAFTTQLACVW